MNNIILWNEWSKAFSGLREAFSRQSTFFWAIIFCAGMSVRSDKRGVSSIVAIMGLKGSCYHSLLRLCHSDALNLEKLLSCWVKVCFRLFRPICIDGYFILLADGIKIGKEGKKMPAVKFMHQSSQSNSKAEYIMGHYLQAVTLAVNTPLNNILSVPLVARIHDGLVFSNRSRETVHDRLAIAIREVSNSAELSPILVADAYYANGSMLNHMGTMGGHLLSRVAHNTVAYLPAIQPKKRKRGRPAVKGPKVVLSSLFDSLDHKFGDKQYSYRNLSWPPAKGLLRFVVCESASKVRIILLSSKLNMDPLTIIKLYEKRWLIETGFNTAVHEFGTFAYHFWMKDMKPTVRRQRKQYLHRETKSYRDQVERKMKAFHAHLAFGCITQGLMLHLAINFKEDVWGSFNGWLRTIRSSMEPSEIVVSNALAATLPNFLGALSSPYAWVKFIWKNIDLSRKGPLTKIA